MMCLRGAHSSCGKPQLTACDISLAVSEARPMLTAMYLYSVSAIYNFLHIVINIFLGIEKSGLAMAI